MPILEGAFLDRIKLRLKAGDGGSGAVSFRHEKYVPLGGPDGGDGGNGGSILLRINRGMNTLDKLHSRPYYVAENGIKGGKNNRSGANGEDIVLEVPPGTVVKDEESGTILVDMEDTGGEIVLLRGGDGGKGNARFATSTNQAPRKFTPGFPGEEATVVFELKTVADIGLIGLPNAGKSTLISAITGAKPRIANYPFTTLQPVLGTILLPDGRGIILADIPGIIQGAHTGEGLGLDFLRHIERTRLLVFVIEISTYDLDLPGQTYRDLCHELKQYDETILERPRAVVLNKADLLADEDEQALVRDAFLESTKDMIQEPLFILSAMQKQNTEPLRAWLVEAYETMKPSVIPIDDMLLPTAPDHTRDPESTPPEHDHEH